MYSWDIWSEKKLHYFKRKERLDKKFVWTKGDVQNLRRLNEGLSQMQETIVEKMREAYEIFSRLEKEGMSFLHGFKVVGWYDFEKSIIAEYDELEKKTRAQEKIYDMWDNIAFCSSGRLRAWRLVLDSESGDFLPLSKARLSEKDDHSWLRYLLDLPKGEEEEDITFCSYLAHLIENNTSISERDLAACTAKDFSPSIKVLLNYPTNELHEVWPRNRQEYYASPDMILNTLEKRCNVLDKTFEWSEKNIQKMMEVNRWLWKRTDEMKRCMTELSAAFKELAKTNATFKNYSIDGQIEYHGSEPNDIATMEIQDALGCFADTAFSLSSIHCNSDHPEIYDGVHDDDSLNWNFEVYRNHFTEEQQKVRFHYFMHAVFIDDHIHSFEDLVRMREEDLKACMEIDFWDGE